MRLWGDSMFLQEHTDAICSEIVEVDSWKITEIHNKYSGKITEIHKKLDCNH
jgi:hypothetical protein